MIRTLLTTTALVSVMTMGAFAQDKTGEAMKPAPIFDTSKDATASGDIFYKIGPGQVLASGLIGSAVYNNAGADAEMVGDVNDIVLDAEGNADAIVVGVGGFLGIGEKDVAVDFSKVNWVDRDGERWLVVELSKEELEAAPAYEQIDTAAVENQPATQEQVATGEAVTEKPAEDTTAAAENNASGDQVAMADREGMSKVDPGAISSEELIGARVYGANDEDIGEIGDVILSGETKVEAFIVDVGGFLGIGEKQVAIDVANIDFMTDADGNVVVFTPFTQEELESQNSYTQDGYKQDREGTAIMAPQRKS